jgi:hypothetical protein
MRAKPGGRRAVIALVAAAGLAYPLAVLAGGAPRFPSRSDCSVRATHDGALELVFGMYNSSLPADALLAQVKKYGFVQAEAVADGCGHVKVALPGYTTLAGARSAVAEAHNVHLNPTIEMASG